MKIEISDHFTYKKLLKFVFPSIIMMLFTSIYGNVDGFFVSNFVDKTAFAAVNMTWPVIMIFGGFGFVFGTGGNAVIATALGEGDKERANRYFSLIVYASLVVGIILGVAGFLSREWLSTWLGAEGELFDDCVKYLTVLYCFTPIFIEQNMFQSLCATAGKPKLGLIATVVAGLGNFVLDFVAIVVLHGGVWGAAIATGMSQFLGGIVPLIYFMRENDSYLQLGSTKFEGKVITKTCTNGISEFVNNLTLSIVIVLYNAKLLELAGQNGVNAFGIIQYILFTFMSVFIGIEMGSAPIISFNNGAHDYAELQNIFKKDETLMLATGVILLALSELLARPFTLIFASGDEELIAMSVHGFRIFAIAFLVMGFNSFSSSLFTALENGFISAAISFIRSFILPIIALYTLPEWFKLDGVWFSQLAVEGACVLFIVPTLIYNNKRYHYFK